MATAASSQPTADSIGSTEYHWSRAEEPLNCYGAGGYHPTAIGDIFGEKYRVIRKLGWGVYSTVWLVQNQIDSSYLALKLLSDNASNTPILHELEYLQKMRDENPEHPGYRYTARLIDHFYHEGVNGRHLALVTELLGESMVSFTNIFGHQQPPVAAIKHLTRQLALSLDYLHNLCNIVHTDIKTSNILCVPNNLEALNLTAQDAVEIWTETTPEGQVVSRVPSRPIRYSLPEDINSAEAWKDFEVKLIDVGVACWADKTKDHFTELIQSVALRAPEVCIGAGWGKPADIWSLGCTVFELITGKALMRRNVNPQSVPYLRTLAFGSYPLDLIKKGKYSYVFFKDDGSLKFTLAERYLLEDQIRDKNHTVALDSIEDLVNFLKLMLQLEPEKQASPKEILAHKWLST